MTVMTLPHWDLSRRIFSGPARMSTPVNVGPEALLICAAISWSMRIADWGHLGPQDESGAEGSEDWPPVLDFANGALVHFCRLEGDHSVTANCPGGWTASSMTCKRCQCLDVGSICQGFWSDQQLLTLPFPADLLPGVPSRISSSRWSPQLSS